MPAIAREPAKVTFDQLDAHHGELIPERTVLSGLGGLGGGGNPVTGLVENLGGGILSGGGL